MSIPMTPSGPAAGLEELTTDAERGTSLWKGAWRRLRRNPSAIIGAIIVLAFIVAAVLTPPDIVSQLSLAIPMCLLYEIGIVAAQYFVRQGKAPGEHPEGDSAKS